MTEHRAWCDYPKGPCDCEWTRKNDATEHRRWCDYPNGPCDCGLEKRKKNWPEGK